MLVLPLAVETSVDPRAATPVTWLVLIVLSGWFLLEQLAGIAARTGWPLLPDAFARGVLWASALGKLYVAESLFEPQQLWTYVGLHAGWWHLISNGIFLAVFGAAFERRVGSIAFLMALAVFAPLTVAPHLLRPDIPLPSLGASGVVSGVMGACWALFRRDRVRCALVYYLIVIVGMVPFRLALRWLVIAYLIQDVLRMVLIPRGAVIYDVQLLGVVIGFALGQAARVLPLPPSRPAAA